MSLLQLPGGPRRPVRQVRTAHQRRGAQGEEDVSVICCLLFCLAGMQRRRERAGVLHIGVVVRANLQLLCFKYRKKKRKNLRFCFLDLNVNF